MHFSSFFLKYLNSFKNLLKKFLKKLVSQILFSSPWFKAKISREHLKRYSLISASSLIDIVECFDKFLVLFNSRTDSFQVALMC